MCAATKSRRGLLTLKTRDLLALRHQLLPAIRREEKTWRRQKGEGCTEIYMVDLEDGQLKKSLRGIKEADMPFFPKSIKSGFPLANSC